MQTLILSLVLLYCILLFGKIIINLWYFLYLILFVYLVQVESLGHSEFSSKLSRKNMVDSSIHSNLLAVLNNRQRQFARSNNDDENESSYENMPDMSYETKKSKLAKRRFFLFPLQRTDRRARPLNSYGRKSHWDTFFG